MLLSMNWISDFVDLDGFDKRALIERFTLSTAEVEDIIERGFDTHNVIAAKVVSLENHPKSQKLHLLKIDTGTDVVDCVCGAPNVYLGMHVAFARAGGAVCGQPIGEATVAGFPSFGMCCSEKELGISDEHGGLMELSADIPLGTDLKNVFDLEDIIFEVDNKSLTNRPDLWGHYGIAREFSTLTGRPLRPVRRLDTTAFNHLPALPITVDEPDLCLRYTGITAENITVRQSPVNMRIRLFYCGSRAINLLADLTNYVMMELGQPMHAFDLRRVNRIEVMRFAEPLSFKTLDGNERQITPDMLMITSNREPVAVAGIMGGLASEIEDDTTGLLLESANFSGVSVRKTSTALGLRTDASMRYEKMLTPELTIEATERFLSLLMDIDPEAKITSSLTDIYPRPYEPIVLTIDKAYVDRYTGIDISSDQIEATLTALGFGVTRENDSFRVVVPAFPATKDVTIKADLIEEITRIYGYDNFDAKTTASALRPVRAERIKSDEAKIKDLLVNAYSLHEVHSYIWSDGAKYRELNLPVQKNVRVINAQTPEHDTLRRSMIPTLLTFLNENKGFADTYGIFEAGHVIDGTDADGMCAERKSLGIALYSREESEEAIFLRARDILALIGEHILHEVPTFSALENKKTNEWEHPKNAFAVSFGGQVLGTLATVHPAVGSAIDKKAVIAFLELDLTRLATLSPSKLSYREVSKYPTIDIDLCFFADTSVLDFPKIKELAHNVAKDTLRDVLVVDIYRGEGGDSITLRFVFSASDRTLTKAELQPTIDKLIAEYAPLDMRFKTV